MDAAAALLLAFDHAWGHAWESLTAVLDGVTEEEAYWQAPAYAADEPESGWPAPGTIAWQVAHIAHCKRYYASIVSHRRDAEPPPTAAHIARPDFAAERAELDAAHEAQRAALLEVTADELEASACGKMPLGEFIAMTTRHDAWHASQIAVARRLYRTR